MKLSKKFGGALRSALISIILPIAVVSAGVLPSAFGSASADAGVSLTFDAPQPLPTTQIDGIVWSQVTVGNTVYATGRFTTARPAGVPLGGAGTVARTNILAYDIRSGALNTSFVHSLTGTSGTVQGKMITASPDGSRVYVGGTFSAVDGQPRSNVAAFDTTSGALVPSFGVSGPSSAVTALSATNSSVYVGGNFVHYGSALRSSLAQVDTNGNLLPWAPSANGHISALQVTPDGSKVVIGGSFSALNGTTYHSIGAVTANSGVAVPWASQSDNFPIRDEDTVNSSAGITSLSTGSNLIFLTAFNSVGVSTPGGFEGRAAIDPNDGHLIWMNDCHGDSYSAIPIGNVLYSVSHSHDCEPAGGFPQATPNVAHHAMAETITPHGVNGPGTNGYWDHQVQPRSDELDWFPVLNNGTVSGMNQAAWSITGNSAYLALGGEFTLANGGAQQGLVRYAVTPLSLSGWAILASPPSPTAVAAQKAAEAVAAQEAAKKAAAEAAKAAAATGSKVHVLSVNKSTRSAAALLHGNGLNLWLPGVTLLTFGLGYYLNMRKRIFVARFDEMLHRFDDITL